MASSYLVLVNNVLRDMNEVELTSSTFASSRGVQTTVKDYIENDEWREDYFSWTFVRNPLDRLLSSYFWVKKPKYKFEETMIDLLN